MFLKNSLKTYLWQIVSFFVRIISLFIITPFISSDKELFGVYTLCISLTMMFNYIDFGFLRSASKFCSEKYSENNFKEEIKYLGFGSLITILFSLIFAFILVYFSLEPSTIINGVDESDNLSKIKTLFLVVAISSPTYVFHRIVQVIYEIRIKSFLYNRIYIIINSLNIISAFYFFSNGNYDLIGYFITLQLLNFISLLIASIDVISRFKYSINDFISSLKFDIGVYRKTKKIAFSSVLIIISWLIFIEIDSLYISNRFGAEKLAVYSIAFTFFTIIRFILTTIFSPFSVRFNYHINDIKYLNNFVKETILVLFPIFVLIVFNFTSISNNFILSWVGGEYLKSSQLSFYLTLPFLLSAISFVTSAYLTTIQDLNKLNLISVCQPILFWCLVLFFSNYFIDLQKFIILKIIIIIISELVLLMVLIRKINLLFKDFILKNLLIIFLPLTLITLCNLYFIDFLPTEKSKYNLLFVIFYYGFISLIGFSSLCIISKKHRDLFFKIFNIFFRKL